VYKRQEDDPETGLRAGDVFNDKIFTRLLDEEYAKLLAAADRDVYDASKTTTLPIARAIIEAYMHDPVKAPWFIDLLNINLNNYHLGVAGQRITQFMETFKNQGLRITENLDTLKA
jgi:malate synthase